MANNSNYPFTYPEFPFVYLVDELKKKYSEAGNADIVDILNISLQQYAALRKMTVAQNNYGDAVRATTALVLADTTAKRIIARLGIKYE